jgi:hypothetical protein
MNYLPYIIVWVLLVVAIIILVLVRRSVAAQEDDTLHVLDSDKDKVQEQIKIAQKLEVIDRWGKIVTIVAIIYTLVLIGAFAYLKFVESSRIPVT